jgi:hypothetical protein
VFAVSIDGTVVSSKRALGRFPTEGEILRVVRQSTGDPAGGVASVPAEPRGKA